MKHNGIMKREHCLEKRNYAFYAPLSQGDLTDHISGQHLQISAGCSCVWNATENAYFFDSTNYTNSYGTPFSWNELSVFSNTSLSVDSYSYEIEWDAKYVDCRFVQGRGASRCTPVFGYVESGNIYLYLNITGYDWFFNNNPYVWNHYKFVASGGTRNLYCNNALMNTASATKMGGKNDYMNRLSLYMIYYWPQNQCGSGYIRNITAALL